MNALMALGAQLDQRIEQHHHLEAQLVAHALESFEAGEMDQLRSDAAEILKARASVLEWWSGAIRQANQGLPRQTRRQIIRKIDEEMTAPATLLMTQSGLEIGRQMIAAITKFETVGKAFANEFADIFGIEEVK